MNTPAVRRESTFVTVLAWVLIIFNAFSIFTALLQNLAINFLFPDMVDAQTAGDQSLPAVPMAVLRVLGAVLLGFAVFLTYAAYALLQRRDWARRLYIGAFALGIAFNVLCLALVGLAFGAAGLRGGAELDALPPELRSVFTGMLIAFAILAVGTSLLFAWLMKQLSTPAVKAEFGA